MLKTITSKIEGALKTAFPKCPIYKEYVKQGFHRPCFCLRTTKVSMEQEIKDRYLATVAWKISCYEMPYGADGDLRLYEKYHEKAMALYGALLFDGYKTQKMSREIVNDILEFTLEHTFYVQKEAKTESQKMFDLTIEME